MRRRRRRRIHSPRRSCRRQKKVFGFGSGGGGGGFGSTTTAAAAAAAAASTSSSSMVVAGAEGSTTTKVSGGFGGVGGGFGSIGSTSNNTSTGFGSATGNAKGWFEGGSVSSNGGSPFGGGGTSSTIQFNFSSNNNNNNAAGENGAAAAGQLLELPDNVELTTGEEEEKVIHEGRCKSFIWVLDDKDETKDGSAGGHDDVTDAAGKANPSVKPSTEFHAAITNITKSEDSSSNNSTDKEDESDDKKDKDDTTTTENGVAAAATEQKQPEHRWQELGIGPMKILRSTVQPDRLRLVQRRESSKMGKATKVILNVPLWKESTCERDRQAQQYLRLKTFKNGKVCSYSLKFKESTDAGYFHHYITDHIPHARECFSK